MTSIASRWLLIGLLLMAAPIAHGENGCPTGFLPTGGAPSAQDPGACRPMASYERPQAPRSPPPPPPRPVPPLEWKPDWGAIAWDDERRTIGSVVEAPTENEAKEGAMKDCQSKGGVDCRLVLAYENACGAFAISDAAWGVQADATEIGAEVYAVRVCTKTGHQKCHVLFKGCSRPNGFATP